MAGVLIGVPLMLHRTAAPAAPLPRPLYRTAQNLDLVMGEGGALQQSAVPVRLPLTLEPLDSPTQSTTPPGEQYPFTVVVSQARAPRLSRALLNLPRVPQNGPLPSVADGRAFPVNATAPGYAVILGTTSEAQPVVSVTSSTGRLSGSVLSFIGEPTTATDLPRATAHVLLGHGLVANVYTARAVGIPGSGRATPAVLIVWEEGRDTYGIYSAGYINPFEPVQAQVRLLARLARTMSRSVITHVTAMTVGLSEFDDANVEWNDHSFQGVLNTETIRIRPAGTPGYRTRDGLGVRVAWSHRRVVASTAPPWPSRSASRPAPALARALPYLESAGVPVRLPVFVPLGRGLWPRLEVNTGPNSYSVFIRESAVNLPPNTPYDVGTGLGAWVGNVEGSRTPIAVNNVPTPNDAPPVRQDQVTAAWLARYASQGYYRGTVVLTNGVKALLAVELAGDGNHTEVVFREQGVYYEVGDYHSARMALRMAASMVAVPAGQ